MLPEPRSLALFLAAALVLLLTPGPAVLFIVARTVERGLRAGLVSALGAASGTLFHIAAAALGLSALLLSSALAFSIVKYLGAAYLIVLGLRTLLAREDEASAPAAADFPATPLGQIYRQAVLVNVLNPKTALFFFAFLPQFVDPRRGSVPAQFVTLGAIFAGMGLVTDSLYALAAGTAARRFRESGRFARARRWLIGSTYLSLGLAAAVSDAGRSK
jgi:threonine/homoserine/homoserine lactone efflux protein